VKMAPNTSDRADETANSAVSPLIAQALAGLVLLWLIERLYLESLVVKVVVAEGSVSLRSATPSENRC
jgi:hypothetical protein